MNPIIKWVGGKRWLVDKIVACMPPTFRDYYEPFCGGAALFFSVADPLETKGRADSQMYGRTVRYVLSDANRDLIQMYTAVRARPHAVVAELQRHEAAHRRNDRRRYDLVKSIWNRGVGDEYQRAAAFLYLNRTCFNGLWRVNKSGEFNVPMGRYNKKTQTICNSDALDSAGRILRRAEFHVRSAFDCPAGASDFVYFDPPYDPISSTSSFTAYSSGGFGEREQTTLARRVRELANLGAQVMVSNSNTKLVRELYKGFRFRRVYRSGSFSSNTRGRGRVAELLITTY